MKRIANNYQRDKKKFLKNVSHQIAKLKLKVIFIYISLYKYLFIYGYINMCSYVNIKK
jgi:hypothetical protein